ncbi:hypothetical protein ABVK25_000360 [Lepraria finkii]|uniref:Uncharacterized protein n=1 Tax=Lepraria finkii TaxID=1340010 RepID=A0ABR4BMN6_9LECA
MPTASNLFGASRETSTSTAFGSTSITETTSTSKRTTSTAPSVLTSADLVQTDSYFSNPFQASYSLSKDIPFAHQSPSPSPAPTPKSRSPQAREARSKASPKPAAAETTALPAETQPAATRNGVSDET